MNLNRDAEDFFESLAPGEVLARCQAAAAQRLRRRNAPRGETAHVSQKWTHDPVWDTECRRLRQAREAADALILRRGGVVPPKVDFWEYLDGYLASQQPKSEAS